MRSLQNEFVNVASELINTSGNASIGMAVNYSGNKILGVTPIVIDTQNIKLMFCVGR